MIIQIKCELYSVCCIVGVLRLVQISNYSRSQKIFFLNTKNIQKNESKDVEH